TRVKLRRCAAVGRGVRAKGRIWIHGPGIVRLGDGVVLDGELAAIELKACDPDSEIVLGDGVEVGPGTSIESVVSVSIGARTRLGCFVKVMDNNFHPLTGDRLKRPPSMPVRIGEEAEIGDRAILLAGSQVGSRARVWPAAVLSRRTPVPEGGTAKGVPAVTA